MTTPDASEGVNSHNTPRPLPGGRAILYTASREDYTSSVNVYLPETDEHRTLADGKIPWFATSGHVVFSGAQVLTGGVRAGELWALPFDVDRLQVAGDAVRVRGNMRVTYTGIVQASVGRDGTLAYVPSGRPTDDRTLVWVNRDGTEEPIDAPPRLYRGPRLSPDGTRIAVSIEGVDGNDIWVLDLSEGSMQRIISRPGFDGMGLWMPRGDRIVFASGSDRPEEIWWAAADGAGQAEQLTPDRPGVGVRAPSSMTADGRTLLLFEFDLTGHTRFDLGSLTMDGAGGWTWKPVSQQPFEEYDAEVSPDGRWVAYGTTEQAVRVFVSPYPEMEGQPRSQPGGSRSTRCGRPTAASCSTQPPVRR